jgi:hypothetical protein
MSWVKFRYYLAIFWTKKHLVTLEFVEAARQGFSVKNEKKIPLTPIST